jgi:redox-sensitive bicupin YhaK (pirin superfamily)
MSGPIDPATLVEVAGTGARPGFGIEVIQGRAARVGEYEVSRILPTKGRRTIGGWCFVDLMIPPDAGEPHPLEVGPHPHIGLSTVTWLFEGEALHGDSLGTEQVIRPGQLNLMTAGHGIAHSELSPSEGVHGVQMWMAQPEATRHGPSGFEHHPHLPTVDLGNGTAKVLVGSFAGARSPARSDTAMVGVEATLRPGASVLELQPGYEYGIVPIDSPVKAEEDIVEPGWLGLIAPGGEALRVETGAGGGRVMLLGGVPLGETIEMWWNFVARTKDELTEAWRAWQDHDTDRFGPVPSKLARIDAPTPPWIPAGGR